MAKIGRQYNFLEKLLRFIEKLIPKKIYEFFQPTYHYLLSLAAAIIYRFPSRKIIVVAVTGTKGKTTTVELLNTILEEAGYKTAMANTLRFKIDKESERNLYKMTLRGRFFVQSFLRKAVKSSCQYAVLEITSEAAKQHRHKFISLDSLIFTNLSPEHIESHGSYENYKMAKLSIGEALERSPKRRRILIVNADDKESDGFLKLEIPEKYKFSLKDAEPFEIFPEGLEFIYEKKRKIYSRLSGKFNLYNILAAVTYAKSQDISMDIIKTAIEKFRGVKGRVEFINEGQDFKVVVDYAHTPDSLEKLYEVFQNSKRICVLGNTGGGRDRWKRKVMAEIAEKYCANIILTDEDPYDENPREIVDEMAKAINSGNYEVVMNRREAIAEAFKHAERGDTVLITGKGTDPYIMGPNSTKTPWSDAEVAREELHKLFNK